MHYAGIIPEGLSDVALVVLLVIFLITKFTGGRKIDLVAGKVDRAAKQLEDHTQSVVRADGDRADRVIQTLMSTTVKPPEECQGYARCREKYRHSGVATDMYQLSGINRVAIELSACVVQLLVAENGEGPPKVGQRAYTTVIKQVALEGSPMRPWIYLNVSSIYMHQILQPLLVKSVLEMSTSELADMNTSDVLTTSTPPIHSMSYYLLDVKTTGIWFMAAYFKQEFPPKLTEDTRQVIREAAGIISQTLPGTQLDTGFYGVGSGMCRWGGAE